MKARTENERHEMLETVKRGKFNLAKASKNEKYRDLIWNLSPKQKCLKQIIVENSRGITLVALVVTIVVLLILAGITLSYALGNTSIFKKAEDTALKVNIASWQERLEIAKGPILINGLGTYDPDAYFQYIQDLEYINNKDENVIDNKDGTYYVTTKPEYVFLITLIPTKDNPTDAKIEYIGKVEDLEPTKEPASALELNSVRARIAIGHTRWLNAVATPSNALQEFEWTSGDTSVATVDNTGKISAVAPGVTVITVRTTDGTNLSKTCNVTVSHGYNIEELSTVWKYKSRLTKDSDGNLFPVPAGYDILEGAKVTEGIVIGRDGMIEQFVWIPIDSISRGENEKADDVRLGRYMDFATTNVVGNYIPVSRSTRPGIRGGNLGQNVLL